LEAANRYWTRDRCVLTLSVRSSHVVQWMNNSRNDRRARHRRLSPRILNQAQSEYKHVLADISRSPRCCHVHPLPIRAAICCHSNETRAPIANPPNSAQLGGTLYRPPTYIRVRAVVWRTAADRHTDRQTDVRDHSILCVVYDTRNVITP